MFSTTALLSLAMPALGAVVDSRSAAPYGWVESTTETASDSQIMHLQVALAYSNIDTLEAKLQAVSDPTSSTYGQYLSGDEVSAAFAPSADSEAKVTDWLKSSGASSISSDGTLVSFTTTKGAAEKMLDTTFTVYTNGATSKLRTLSYSVPDSLGDAIDLITPTTYFDNTRAHAAVPPVARQAMNVARTTSGDVTKRQDGCEIVNFVIDNTTYLSETPQCLQVHYNTIDYVPDPNSGSTVAFGNFLNESASYSDLAVFEKLYGYPSQNFTVLALINGGVNDQNPTTEMDGEANLDVQNIITIAHGLPVYTYITGGSPPFIPNLLSPNQSDNENEPYLQYYQYLLAQPDSALPWVITNSYGDDEETVPFNYATRVCNMIGMMGLRGRTILESSGDEGVGAACRANSDLADLDVGKEEFMPEFPGTCPYVTAVGGTQFWEPEYAWNASSGGFSIHFPRAWYQEEAIEKYLNEYISPEAKEYYSVNGYADFGNRGVPDMSAHSLYPWYITVEDGQPEPNGGTSAASPISAGVIALLNDARFRAGKPAMGFINPWLYAYGAEALNDVTNGGSLGCVGYSLQDGSNLPAMEGWAIIPYASWNATPGWDPATGMGTPNLQKMLQVAVGSQGHGW